MRHDEYARRQGGAKAVSHHAAVPTDRNAGLYPVAGSQRWRGRLYL